MFFIIPIGSEEGVRRLPYLTIGLIVINVIVWLITNSVYNNQMKELVSLDQRLSEIESYYVYSIIERDPNFLVEYRTGDSHERFLKEDVMPYDSQDYEEWNRLYDLFKAKSHATIYDKLGATPSKLDFFKIVTSLFVHGNFLHLLFNMLFLWLVGCNIEDDWSWKVFLGLYLVSGVVAALMHSAMYPQSDVPLVGASGAIAGIMGAFMIRHYKTKIRMAYFVWVLIARPFFGTFAVYAGIVLPFWFLTEVYYAAAQGAQSGTAHYAHIGGFVFGALIGVSMKFFGLEKKYIAPMVEDSFEKLKMSPAMKEATKKLECGDSAGAIPLLLKVTHDEPSNFDAPLTLARLYYGKGHPDDAVVMYNKAFDIVLQLRDMAMARSLYEELKEKGMVEMLSERNMYTYATFLEESNQYQDAVQIFGLYARSYPSGRVRPKALYRTYILYRDALHDTATAQSALELLQQEYPEWVMPKVNPKS